MVKLADPPFIIGCLNNSYLKIIARMTGRGMVAGVRSGSTDPTPTKFIP